MGAPPSSALLILAAAGLGLWVLRRPADASELPRAVPVPPAPELPRGAGFPVLLGEGGPPGESPPGAGDGGPPGAGFPVSLPVGVGGAEPPPEPPPGPGGLVKVPAYGGKTVLLRADAAAALATLQAAGAAAGFAPPLLLPVSGYRDRATQERAWNKALVRYKSPEVARKWVARPRYSSHGTGLAVDLWLGFDVDSDNVKALRATPVWQWLNQYGNIYGWYSYNAEPWHWEAFAPHDPTGERYFRDQI